ncbi:SHOCT domain-containing protein [Methanolapillus millepedarum]|uniref:SHOCT domain-containing protein n=1 Tax=Methanolapillus millepedarum TaxID=3028296 RepID=A0AA96ZUZ0_9EURY|nr:hypothetical protein MsAc7_17220 [Methanosarcinaceae archaeon Ac7]
MAGTCDVCGNKLGLFNTFSISGGYACKDCANVCISYATTDAETLKKYKEEFDSRISRFKKTNQLISLIGDSVTIDDTNRFFYFDPSKVPSKNTFIYSFDEVYSYEIKETDGTTVTKTKGGITRAAVGGLVFGGAGAVVGAATAKTETTKKNVETYMIISFNTYSGKKQKMFKNQAILVHVRSFLDKCIDESTPKVIPSAGTSTADEILKFKNLMDAGVITPEEFEAKKKQLLNL